MLPRLLNSEAQLDRMAMGAANEMKLNPGPKSCAVWQQLV